MCTQVEVIHIVLYIRGWFRELREERRIVSRAVYVEVHRYRIPLRKYTWVDV